MTIVLFADVLIFLFARDRGLRYYSNSGHWGFAGASGRAREVHPRPRDQVQPSGSSFRRSFAL